MIPDKSRTQRKSRPRVTRKRVRVRLRTPAAVGRKGRDELPSRPERRSFEDLLVETTASFVSLPAAEAQVQVDRGLRLVGEFLDVDQCYFNRFTADGTRFYTTNLWTADGSVPDPTVTEIPLNERFPWFTERMREGETLILNGPDDLPLSAASEREYWLMLGLRSVLVIPIVVGGCVCCSIGFTSVRKSRRWPAELVRQLRLFGEIFGNALVRARNELELNEQLQFEKFVAETSSRFVNLPTGEVEAEIGQALERLGRLMDVDRAFLLQLSEDHAQLRVTHMQVLDGVAQDPMILTVRIEDQFHWLTCKLAAGEQVRVSRIEDLPEEASAEVGYCREIGIKAFAMAPLTVSGEFRGAIGFDVLREERVWPEETHRRLRIVGELFANALTRKQNEDALRRTSERFKVLLESTHAIPWVADARTWRFTYIGPQALQLFGYPLEEWCQEGFWVEHIHPDDQEYTVEYCRRSSARLGAYEFEYRMLSADGKVVWLQDIVSVESSGGTPETLRGFMIDISERKLAEEAQAASEAQLHLIADALPVLIAYIGTDQRYQFVNKEYQRLYASPREKILGQTVREVNGDEDYETIRPHVEQALTGQQVRYEASFPLPDGSQEHYQATYVPRLDRDGRVLGFYSLSQDITEWVRSEEESRRHQQELAHVSRVAMMGELATGLAHEINQPLCAIISNAQSGQRLLLGELFERQELREMLSDITADGRRASEVIQKLRAFLKGGRLERRPLDLNEVCREVSALLRRDAVERKVNLRLELADPLPGVLGDAIHLQQVLINLLLNAFEAMESTDPASRDLIVRTSAEDPTAVMVSVQDSGSGVQEDAAGQIFEPFFTTKEHGLGMGLSICRTIVEAHDGRLWVTRNPERGTTFHLALPRLEEETSPSGEDRSMVPERSGVS